MSLLTTNVIATRTKKLLAYGFVILGLMLPGSLFAATLQTAPSSGSYSVGQTFTVSLTVDAGQSAINAISGTVLYPSDTLQVTSLSKSSSIINFWVTEPSFSTASGKIHFEGIVLNPGYSGHAGTILKVSFKAKSQGTAKLSFQSSSVLANDGEGTNVLTSTGSASFTIGPAVPSTNEPTTPTPPSEPVVAPPPSSITLSPKEELEVPIITDYPESVKSGDYAVVKGITYPNIRVVVSLTKRAGEENFWGHLNYTSNDHSDYTTKTIIRSDEHGDFSYVSPKQITSGSYTLSVQALGENGDVSKTSDLISFSVAPSSFIKFGGSAVQVLVIIVPLLALIILLLWMVFVAFRKFRLLMRDVRERTTKAENLVDRSFAVLNDDVSMLAKVPHGKISREEQTLLNLHKRDLEEARHMIDQNVDDIAPKSRYK